jgi:hypothetical protein
MSLAVLPNSGIALAIEAVSPNLARRSFLRLASAAAFSFGFLARSQAAESNAPPKPQNVLSSW